MESSKGVRYWYGWSSNMWDEPREETVEQWVEGGVGTRDEKYTIRQGGKANHISRSPTNQTIEEWLQGPLQSPHFETRSDDKPNRVTRHSNGVDVLEEWLVGPYADPVYSSEQPFNKKYMNSSEKVSERLEKGSKFVSCALPTRKTEILRTEREPRERTVLEWLSGDIRYPTFTNDSEFNRVTTYTSLHRVVSERVQYQEGARHTHSTRIIEYVSTGDAPSQRIEDNSSLHTTKATTVWLTGAIGLPKLAHKWRLHNREVCTTTRDATTGAVTRIQTICDRLRPDILYNTATDFAFATILASDAVPLPSTVITTTVHDVTTVESRFCNGTWSHRSYVVFDNVAQCNHVQTRGDFTTRSWFNIYGAYATSTCVDARRYNKRTTRAATDASVLPYDRFEMLVTQTPPSGGHVMPVLEEIIPGHPSRITRENGIETREWLRGSRVNDLYMPLIYEKKPSATSPTPFTLEIADPTLKSLARHRVTGNAESPLYANPFLHGFNSVFETTNADGKKTLRYEHRQGFMKEAQFPNTPGVVSRVTQNYSLNITVHEWLSGSCSFPRTVKDAETFDEIIPVTGPDPGQKAYYAPTIASDSPAHSDDPGLLILTSALSVRRDVELTLVPSVTPSLTPEELVAAGKVALRAAKPALAKAASQVFYASRVYAASAEHTHAARVRVGFSGAGILLRALFTLKNVADVVLYERNVSQPISMTYIRQGLHIALFNRPHQRIPIALLYDPHKVHVVGAFERDAQTKGTATRARDTSTKKWKYDATTYTHDRKRVPNMFLKPGKTHLTDFAMYNEVATERYHADLPNDTIAGYMFKASKLSAKPHVWWNEIYAAPLLPATTMEDAIIGICFGEGYKLELEAVYAMKLAVDTYVKPGLPVYAYSATAGTLERITDIPGYAGALGGRGFSIS
jgi:hypothetical protein